MANSRSGLRSVACEALDRLGKGLPPGLWDLEAQGFQALTIGPAGDT